MSRWTEIVPKGWGREEAARWVKSMSETNQWFVGKIQQLTVKPESPDLTVARHTLKALDDRDARIAALEAKLRRCREVMECNDPLNASDIFGPPDRDEQP